MRHDSHWATHSDSRKIGALVGESLTASAQLTMRSPDDQRARHRVWTLKIIDTAGTSSVQLHSLSFRPSQCAHTSPSPLVPAASIVAAGERREQRCSAGSVEAAL